MRVKQFSTTVAAVLLLAAAAAAQQGNRITIPLSDPSRPATIRGNLINGGFNVSGYDGKDVVIQIGKGREKPRRVPREAEGLRRIDLGSSGVSVTEKDNVVQIETRGGDDADVSMQVPYNTSLKLNCVNGDGIQVDHVRGEIDVTNTNGKVTLRDVSGAVVAHALNDRLTVIFDELAPDKPMSFSSLNGDVDVTLPASTKARIKVKSQNGEVYTDFDITTEQIGDGGPGSRDRRGRYRASLGTAIVGTINGGGPELTFTTLNGKVFIRKKK